MIVNFRNLQIYQESFKLQVEIEELLKSFPREEQYLLADQMRRSCRAIPALIAEGWSKRESVKEFQKFLRDVVGEANEMINHLMLAKHKNYIKDPVFTEKLIERYEVIAKKTTNLKNNWRVFK